MSLEVNTCELYCAARHIAPARVCRYSLISGRKLWRHPVTEQRADRFARPAFLTVHAYVLQNSRGSDEGMADRRPRPSLCGYEPYDPYRPVRIKRPRSPPIRHHKSRSKSLFNLEWKILKVSTTGDVSIHRLRREMLESRERKPSSSSVRQEFR